MLSRPPVTVSLHPTADVVPDLMMPPVVGNPPNAADQVDYTVAGATDALLRGEQGEPTLAQTLPQHTTELGDDLSDKVKAKIWANEYVDFYELVGGGWGLRYWRPGGINDHPTYIFFTRYTYIYMCSRVITMLIARCHHQLISIFILNS